MLDNMYRLEGKIPVLCKNLEEYTRAFDIDNRIVAKTEVAGTSVSTVFLCLDHRISLSGSPILFETMIFDNSSSEDYCERYLTWDEAVAGHIKACKKTFGVIPEEDNHSGKKDFVKSIVRLILSDE